MPFLHRVTLQSGATLLYGNLNGAGILFSSVTIQRPVMSHSALMTEHPVLSPVAQTDEQIFHSTFVTVCLLCPSFLRHHWDVKASVFST